MQFVLVSSRLHGSLSARWLPLSVFHIRFEKLIDSFSKKIEKLSKKLVFQKNFFFKSKKNLKIFFLNFLKNLKEFCFFFKPFFSLNHHHS